MNYRLALDLGTNSIGWSMYELDNEKMPINIIDSGVRIFSDSRNPKDGTSLAAFRREKRGMRRNRDRYLRRRTNLMYSLVKLGLMPEDETDRKKLELIDPYEIRKSALDEKVEIYHFGRAIFHINQRRGFKSNRKADRGSSEAGVMKSSISDFKNKMEQNGARTVGEMLYELHKDNKPCRARLHGSGKEARYDIYVERAMAEHEFDILWAKQNVFHPEVLTEEAYEEIKDCIFYQRPLKPVQVGKCSCESTEDRAAKALPVSQLFRIWQTITDLRIIDIYYHSTPLTDEQKELLLEKLLTTKDVSFDTVRKLFGLNSSYKFSHEHEDKLKGDLTCSVMKKYFKNWADMSLDEQSEIMHKILDEDKEETVVNYLMQKGLNKESAVSAANAGGLVDGHMSFCEPVMRKLIESMKKGLDLTNALKENGYEDRNPNMNGSYDKLPYYASVMEKMIGTGTGKEEDWEEKRFGKIANPTVHRGLKQIQRLVNALIDKYGKPSEVAIELGRELKMSQKQKKEIEKQNRENEKLNIKFVETILAHGQKNTRDNRDRLKLWEELDKNPLTRTCVYCGKTISQSMLFGSEVEVEHILPFSRTLDNSLANRTVSCRSCNRKKTNQSPFEAFGKTDQWVGILARAGKLPKNKQWRFSPDAMESFEKENGFLDRQLTDMQYYSKAARLYLTAVCKDTWSVSGRLTASVRRWTGLNGILSSEFVKNRSDHRHHAVDALAIGLVNRSLLQKISTLSAKNEMQKIDDMLSDKISFKPWENFFEDAKKAIDSIVVSHKQEHGRCGAMHDETAYSVVYDNEGKNPLLVTRKQVQSLTDGEIDNIIDKKIRNMVQDEIIGLSDKEKKEALAKFGEKYGINKVRYYKKQDNFININDKSGKPFKAYISGDYHHIDVYEGEKGKTFGETATYFDINNKNYMPAWKKLSPKPKLLMRLHKKDILKISKDGIDKFYVVLKLEPSNSRAVIVETTTSGKVDEITRNKELRIYLTYSKIKAWNVKKVKVSEIGEIKELRY